MPPAGQDPLDGAAFRPAGGPPEAPRRQANDRTEPLGEVLKRWIRKSGAVRLSEREQIEAAWKRMLGRDAPHTSLSSMRDHVVTFTADSSPLLSELATFRKQELLEGLRAEVKSYFIRDIRFRLQKTSGPGRLNSKGSSR